MFFLGMEGWREHMEALGIQEVIDRLNTKGLPTEWPTRVADPKDKHVFYHPKGKPWYESSCHCYEGYYLGGSSDAVKCSASRELLPGTVWYTMCQKGHENCPFFRKGNDDG